MRTIAALAAGVLLSLMTFVAGVFGTVIYLSDMHAPNVRKSADVSDLWTLEPVAVAANDQRLERVAAVSVHKQEQTESVYPVDGDETPDVDVMETGSTSNVEHPSFAEVEARKSSHIEWCMTRYNSYRTDDDTYQPYHGGRRRCNSPYQDVASNDIAAFAASAQAHTTGDDGGDVLAMQAAYIVDEEHAQRCSARYRSYRFEDNSYQPLSGGPRRQCR